MGMKALEELKEMLCEELDKVAEKGELTAGSLETVDKLAHSIKNIDKIIMSYEGEQSSAGGWMAEGSYRGGSYNNGGSYRGRSSREGGSSREGRSSREGGSSAYGNSSYGRGSSRGSYASRYSRADNKEKMIEELEQMMNEASSDKEQKAIERCIEQLEMA